MPALAAGATSLRTTAITIPAGTAPATYYLIAVADGTGVVVETLETNNTRGEGDPDHGGLGPVKSGDIRIKRA